MAHLTLAEFRARRIEKLTTWLVEFLPFAGTPLDNGRRCGTVERFYADEAEARAAVSDLCSSGHVERVDLVVWRYSERGRHWYRTPVVEWEAPPAVAVETIGPVTWWGSEADGFDGEAGCCTVAHVRRAEAGEAEGGLGALMRLMAGARGIDLVEPSAAGWYWNASIRGVWTGPTLAASPEAARAAASAYVVRGV
jgi:hypothetical protein